MGLKSAKALWQRLRRGKPDTSEPGRQEGTAACVDSSGTVARIDQILVEADTLNAKRRYARSLAAIDQALEGNVGNARLLFAKAVTFFRWRRYREAMTYLDRASAAGLHSAELLTCYGWTCFHLGRYEEAEQFMRQVIQESGPTASAAVGLGRTLCVFQRHAEAVASFECALSDQPECLEAMLGLGNSALVTGDLATAEHWLRRATETPDGATSAVAWNFLGVAIGKQDRYEEALQVFSHAMSMRGTADAQSVVNAAIGLRDGGFIAEALELLEENLPERPDVDGHLSYAHGLIIAGRMLDGWHQLEFRWLRDPLLSLRARLPCPVWNGQDLRGKVLLLRVEQGFGDTIQFIRYAPRLKELGASPAVDYCINMMSLPRVFGTECHSIPADVPYLTVSKDALTKWAPLVGGLPGLRVGMVWAGSPLHQRDRYRSLTLEQLIPLSTVDDVSFVSLQKGPRSRDIERYPEWRIVDLDAQLTDFEDTAAAMCQLDLVICVDTAVAHLAGALGVPVWMLLPQPADFRWMNDRADSPWYPSMRLFRQTQRARWDDVIAVVRSELASACIDRKSLRPGGWRVLKGLRSPRELPATRWQYPTALLRRKLSSVAETRYGILQYFPHEPDIGESIGYYGEYRQMQLEVILGILQPGAVVAEFDAGVDARLLPVSAALGESGHLFVCEARAPFVQVARQNITANKLLNVSVVELTAAASRNSEGERAEEADEQIDGLGMEALDMLMLADCGVALQRLRGAAATLWRLRPRVHVVAESGQHADALSDLVKTCGYRCWKYDVALYNPDNFNRRTDDLTLGGKAYGIIGIPEERDVLMQVAGCVEI